MQQIKKGECIMSKTIIFEKKEKISEKQIQEVKAASKKPIEFDEDCPELSPALQNAFREAVKNRNRTLHLASLKEA